MPQIQLHVRPICQSVCLAQGYFCLDLISSVNRPSRSFLQFVLERGGLADAYTRLKFQLVPSLLNLQKHHARQVKEDQAFFALTALWRQINVSLMGRRDR